VSFRATSRCQAPGRGPAGRVRSGRAAGRLRRAPRPEQFQPLGEEEWDEERVRAAIRAIVADADAALDPDGLSRAHEWDGWQAALPLKNLYVGAAGSSSGAPSGT
jgi:hypothetical protein